MSNIELLKEMQAKKAMKKKIRNFFVNLIFILTIFVMVISIPVGIWYEPFPFWKVFGTGIFVLIMCLIFHKK